MDLPFYKARLWELQEQIVALDAERRAHVRRDILCGKIVNKSEVMDPLNTINDKPVTTNSTCVTKTINSENKKERSNPLKSRNFSQKGNTIQQTIYCCTEDDQDFKRKDNWWQDPHFIDEYSLPLLPFQPKLTDHKADLIHIAKLVFKAFDVSISCLDQIDVKKYRNCVLFTTNTPYNVMWRFNGTFYFGGWKNHSENGYKHGQGIESVPGRYLYKGEFI